ncbi:hypothetical protein CEXT_177931 [Caerostris extrusa]|uniref:Uncharacterized protein n=1 Tax=Caerostris extrusa TaxID=172846 RepID=A0AAV4P954_CAEEX|nr:hypothetical protein CEXT_177931 [Caerostris extrusa]
MKDDRQFRDVAALRACQKKKNSLCVFWRSNSLPCVLDLGRIFRWWFGFRRKTSYTGTSGIKELKERPRATTSSEDQYLRLCAHLIRIATPSNFKSSFVSVTGRDIIFLERPVLHTPSVCYSRENVADFQPFPKPYMDLELFLRKQCALIPMQLICNITNSITHRYQTNIAFQGGHTHC